MMENTEIIKALRCCASPDTPCKGLCSYHGVEYCLSKKDLDAADALEEYMKMENALRSLIDGRGDPVSCNVDAILKGEYE